MRNQQPYQTTTTTTTLDTRQQQQQQRQQPAPQTVETPAVFFKFPHKHWATR